MKHIRTIIEFEGKDGKIYSVQFTGIHNNLTAKVYANKVYLGVATCPYGHANKTQALRSLNSILNRINPC